MMAADDARGLPAPVRRLADLAVSRSVVRGAAVLDGLQEGLYSTRPAAAP